MSKLQFMSALLRDCLHKRYGLKLLLLSCCLMPSWALPLKSVLLLWQTSHRCAQYPTRTGLRVAEYPSAAFTSQQLQLGSGNERVGRWVEKAYFLNREMHVLAEFPKATIRNTPRFTSSSSGSHLRTAFLSYQQLSSFSTVSLLTWKYRECRNQHRNQHREPSPQQPFLHLLHTFREESYTNLSSHSASK